MMQRRRDMRKQQLMRRPVDYEHVVEIPGKIERSAAASEDTAHAGLAQTRSDRRSQLLRPVSRHAPEADIDGRRAR